MPHLKNRALLVALAFAMLWPGAAYAGGSLPITLGIGTYVPTSPSSSVEGFAPFPGTTVKQNGNFGLEVSLGPELRPGSYQISTMLLSQRQVVSPGPIFGAGPQNETITQIPITIESTNDQFAAVRFGGGLGYDFVSYPQANGAQAGSGIVGDTFLQIGIGSGAALQAKYFFGNRAALGGVFVGVTTRL